MSRPEDSLLGRETAYPGRYDPALLFPVPRAPARRDIGIAPEALPFAGHDRWQAYELSWLDARGKPQVDTATLYVPCASDRLIESKSLKLYLNSLNDERFADREALRTRIVTDLSACAGADVGMDFGLPPMQAEQGECIDDLDIVIDHYGPPNAGLLATGTDMAEEILYSRLLKSNCPVTGQPDWATLTLHYRGPRIERAGLLRYIVSFRHHSGFHEQCVERIFIDLMARCQPQQLAVEARYTRRGGLDINPCRVTLGVALPAAIRDLRQ
ncbi:NADPH-dependent 7-cyano-7-deazaguanine reductase QueF [Pseudoxanthomonas kalamensis DSM 18571]|uniref:NADPH-dependent 7-cyano-7-deazaguanine reductase QueF n=1 Tax=Pseudoxanthomonas kalamensis TaxID=289483 RepID=UPI001391F1F2|nr:NADPH-dependent 7-cyano-7-deazaguanine reductase QueF [Pseudoxanthomonas kalamensis]KAF1712357.1 NADPH-dependent 7-cyano-7-deazaguanine reductase QueF [Pseudoxanthomonas kalamensis DSM 18571]